MTLQLEIHALPVPFRFEVLGSLEPRLEPVWKDAADPPEVVDVREVWEVRGARLLAPDGDEARIFEEWRALLGRLRVRGPGFPLWARLVRDPQGAAEVVLTLGPPTHERFKVVEVGAGAEDQAFPRSVWRALVPVSLVLSAAQRLADPNGIVGWEQETSSRFDPGGLHFLEWRTRLTTREGTSALELARRFGRIEIRPFGPSYTYDTNGPEGVEVSTADADEPNARVPTSALAVCRIRQWGVHVGTTGPGSSPTEVSYSTRTRLEKGERTTTVRATARGPGALTWVEGKAPTAPAELSEVFHEEAQRYAEGTWTGRGDSEVQWQIQTELSGGHQDFDFEPVAGGYEPVLFEGALLPWRLVVTLKGQRRGGEGRLEDLPLPGLLPEPWLLDRAASREKEPYSPEEARAGAPSGQWVREAVLVYWSARRPTSSPVQALRAAQPVRSYYL